MEAKDLRASWGQAWFTLTFPVLLFLTVRWVLIEPYVIPSGSMIPTLLVHDHIFVNKLAFGVRWPFSQKWMTRIVPPQRGDIVVFRYPKNPEVFYVKRAIAFAGEKVKIDSGQVFVNGVPISLTLEDLPPLLAADAESDFDYFKEEQHWVRYRNKPIAYFDEVTVPEGSFFVLGDNRDQSNDSRYWGFVPYEIWWARLL